MKDLAKINRKLGWIVGIGMILTQLIFTKFAYDMGGMGIYIAALLAMLLLPFIIIAVVSVLNREKHLNKIKVGIGIAIILQCSLPFTLIEFVDSELMYFGFIGVFFGCLVLLLRKDLEKPLFIINTIGAIIWLLISTSALLSE